VGQAARQEFVNLCLSAISCRHCDDVIMVVVDFSTRCLLPVVAVVVWWLNICFFNLLHPVALKFCVLNHGEVLAAAMTSYY